MKTLILYATKYGAAAEIAQRIAEKLNGADTHNLKNPIPDLTEYDCIIIGSSVYAGMFRREAKAFFAKTGDTLLQKKLGLFASALSSDGASKIFAKNVPDNILKSSKSAILLGGIFDPGKANFIERFIIKIITKQTGRLGVIDSTRIDSFAGEMLR